MASIVTNSSAITAVSALKKINAALERTQNQFSSGMKVQTAADNAAYWSIATTMRSDNKALSAVSDAMNLGTATADVAYSAMESSIELLDKVKQRLVGASEPGVDRGKVQMEIDQLRKQLVSVVDSASFNGENWLKGGGSVSGPTETTVVSGFTRDTNGHIALQTLKVDLTKSILLNDSGGGLLQTALPSSTGTHPTTGLMDMDITVPGVDMDDYIDQIEIMLQSVTNAAADVGSMQMRLSQQASFTEELMDSVDRGVGTLIDPDLNQASSLLKAQQTQKQLATQALSIANSSNDSILQLFQ